MARVTEAEVTTVINTSLTTAQVVAFIEDANTWVDHYLGGYTGLSAAVLKAIEKYLACHLITLRDPRLKRARTDDIDETYQRDDKVTEYLKQAAAFDPTGTVADELIGSEPKAIFRVGAGYDDTLDLPDSSS